MCHYHLIYGMLTYWSNRNGQVLTYHHLWHTDDDMIRHEAIMYKKYMLSNIILKITHYVFEKNVQNYMPLILANYECIRLYKWLK